MSGSQRIVADALASVTVFRFGLVVGRKFITCLHRCGVRIDDLGHLGACSNALVHVDVIEGNRADGGTSRARQLPDQGRLAGSSARPTPRFRFQTVFGLSIRSSGIIYGCDPPLFNSGSYDIIEKRFLPSEKGERR